MTYELTNEQREYFGLDPVQTNWERVPLKGDTYRPESILYFDDNTIKRHIISTANEYNENQYNELTAGRTILLPKTKKGKPKKLSASVLEQRLPTGVYINISNGDLMIGNYNSQTTFYSSRWSNEQQKQNTIPEIINHFIETSPENYLIEIAKYKALRRRNIKFNAGDYFCFKMDRTNYGFGRILLDVGKLRKKGLINSTHGLNLPMGIPLIIELFVFRSPTKYVDIELLDKQAKLPSDLMMDNLLLYGEYEIIGNRKIEDQEFEFPISYGQSIDGRKVVFLQWGLIHKELPQEIFSKYIFTTKTQVGQNPYGFYSIGLSPRYDSFEIVRAIDNDSRFSFANAKDYSAEWDLRNPKNEEIRTEIFKAFGLDPNKTYYENSLLAGTILPSEIIEQTK